MIVNVVNWTIALVFSLRLSLFLSDKRGTLSHRSHAPRSCKPCSLSVLVIESLVSPKYTKTSAWAPGNHEGLGCFVSLCVCLYYDHANKKWPAKQIEYSHLPILLNVTSLYESTLLHIEPVSTTWKPQLIYIAIYVASLSEPSTTVLLSPASGTECSHRRIGTFSHRTLRLIPSIGTNWTCHSSDVIHRPSPFWASFQLILLIKYHLQCGQCGTPNCIGQFGGFCFFWGLLKWGTLSHHLVSGLNPSEKY